MKAMPIAASIALARRVATRTLKTRGHTDSGEKHQEWEGDDPKVHRKNNVATVKLYERPRQSFGRLR